jgi:hypothetical protein
MSRAPLILSAAAIFCASSLVALADARTAIGTAAASSAFQNAVPHHKRLEYPQYRHYRGYDETPSAMAAWPNPV